MVTATGVSDSTKKIQEKILKDAENEAQRLKSEAKEKAEQIIKEAKQRAKELKKEKIAKVKRHMDETWRQDIAEKKVDYHRRTQSLKTDLIDDTFDKAKEELQKYVEKPTYQETLKALVTEAGIALGGGELTISLIAADKRKFSREIMEKLEKQIQTEVNVETSIRLDEKPLHAIGGVVVSVADQTATLDDTFDARLERTKEREKAELERILLK